MSFDKVLFGFFVLLALTLNVGFVYGDVDNAAHHHVWELFAALVVSLIATVLKFGDRSHLGAVLLASSLVADLHLVAAAIVWGVNAQVFATGEDPSVVTSVVSLACGALVANLASVILLVVETLTLRR
ncbi:MAG: DUF6394 family protein [Oceanococcaceae bacterium]